VIDEPTRRVYDRRAAEWDDARADKGPGAAARLAGRLGPGAVVADLGCGSGLLLRHLPDGAVGLDASAAMLAVSARRVDAPLVHGDVGHLPWRTGSLDGAVVANVYVHLDRAAVLEALAELHRALRVDGVAELTLFGHADAELAPAHGDSFPGRRFSHWSAATLRDVVEGAGFGIDRFATVETDHWPRHELSIRRLRTLPDRVGPGMRLLVCGLNPSLHAADMGVGFGRPGNRFWPAALAAGLAGVDRDPTTALRDRGMGMTDLAKRATRRADELDPQEYRDGLDRVDRLCAWLRPHAVCMVGLAGWRTAMDRRAAPGWQPRRLGGRPVFVMPSTSGLNAHSSLEDLTDQLRTALAGPPD